MLLSYAQDAGAHGHTIDDLARLHLGPHPQPARRRDRHRPHPAAARAGAGPTVRRRTWRRRRIACCACATRLRPRLADARATALYERMERRLIPVLADMEDAGIEVDEAELRRLSADFGERMAAAEVDIHRLAGRSFNLGSPKVLGEILFDEMKLPGGRRTGSGTWGTEAATLQQLAEGGAELPARIIEWRQLSKLKSTYADALVEEVRQGTRRIHTTYAMAATTTGRLSSNDPEPAEHPDPHRRGRAASAAPSSPPKGTC